METKMGLWIDRQRAVAYAVSDAGEELRVFPFGADESREGMSPQRLHDYYDSIALWVMPSQALFISGPEERRVEMEKRWEKGRFRSQTFGTGEEDLTVRQIALRFRDHFREDDSVVLRLTLRVPGSVPVS